MIHKYMNKEQWNQMIRSTKEQLPSIKYHNNNCIHDLRYHISSLVDIFITPEAYGAHISAEGKSLYFKYSFKKNVKWDNLPYNHK